MFIYYRVSLVISAVIFSLLSACSAPPPPMPGRDPIARADYPNVVVTPRLARKLVVSNPVIVPPRDFEPLAVRVPVRSAVRQPLLLEYRLVFYSRNDEQLTTNPIWIPIEIPARTRRIISSNAISRDATRWELEIRER